MSTTDSRLHFYDAANPGNVPSGVLAAVYINGFVWPDFQVDRMAGTFAISVLREPGWARFARCLDIESHAALPEDLVPFLHERARLGHRDGTGYVNRSNWKAAAQDVKDNRLPMPHWWVSTLDGTQEVVEHLDDGTELRAWAVQYFTNGRYDLSILHGVDNFHRPR